MTAWLPEPEPSDAVLNDAMERVLADRYGDDLGASTATERAALRNTLKVALAGLVPAAEPFADSVQAARERLARLRYGKTYGEIRGRTSRAILAQEVDAVLDGLPLAAPEPETTPFPHRPRKDDRVSVDLVFDGGGTWRDPDGDAACWDSLIRRWFADGTAGNYRRADPRGDVERMVELMRDAASAAGPGADRMLAAAQALVDKGVEPPATDGGQR